MKKLLSLLGALTIVASTSVSVVSCGSSSENKHLNGDGDSIWAWLPELGAGNDVTSKTVWNEIDPFGNSSDYNKNPMNWDPKTRETAAIKTLQIFSVSLLANSDKLPDAKGFADWDSLKTKFKADWETLKSNVDRQVEAKKEDLKTQYNKKWEQKYKDFLKDNYDGKEENYKASLMATGTNNASQLIHNDLVNSASNFDMSKTNETRDSLVENYTNWKDQSSAEAWMEKSTNNTDLGRLIAMSTTPLDTADTNDYNALWTSDEMNEVTITGSDKLSPVAKAAAKCLANIYKEIKDGKHSVNDFVQIQTPLRSRENSSLKIGEYDKRSVSSATTTGYLNQFQTYELKQWFEMNSPVATTQIDFGWKSTDSDKLNKKVSLDRFEQNTQDDITNLLVKGTYGTTWADIVNNLPSSIKATPNGSLLTTAGGGSSTSSVKDGASSVTQSAAVYSALTDGANSTALTGSTTLDSLFKLIDRSSNQSSADNKMYTKLELSGGTADKTINDNSLIATVDDSGLHLIHIDGAAALGQWSSKDAYKWDMKDTDANKNLDFFNNNISADSPINKADMINWKNDDLFNTGKKAFNQQIDNSYLQFLTNMSYVNNNLKDSSLYKFDIMNQMSDFASLDGSTAAGSTKWYTWIYDLVNHMYKDVLGQSTDWLSNFMTINTPDASGNKTSWLDQEISVVDNKFGGNYNLNSGLIKSIQAENLTIDKYKDTGAKGHFDANWIYNNVINSSLWNWDAKSNKGGN